MKVAIITDTHWGARRASKTFQNHYEDFYAKVFFPALQAHRVTTVVHMGDAFDSRKTIDIGGLEWTKKVVLDNLKPYTVHLITGNHDCYYKNTNSVNSPDLLLREYPNIKTYSKISDIKLGSLSITLIPWICSDNYESTMEHIEKTTSTYAMGHLELSGFVIHPGHISETGMDPNIFKKFDQVYSGHFHARSNNKNVRYLGNPYEMFWSDCGDPRGFHILDTETLELKIIENPHCLFYKIYYDDREKTLDDISFDNYKDKIVKVIIKKKQDQKKFDKFFDKLYNSGPQEIKVVDNQDIFNNELFSVDDDENTLNLLNRYIDDCETEVDKEKSKLIIHNLYKTACEVVE
jgi:hypothetical protein